MLPVLLLVVLVAFQSLRLARAMRLARAAVREREAVDLDCDMSMKFHEMLDDPQTTARTWRDWLPVFEQADAEIRAKGGDLPLGRTSEFVRMEIAGRLD